MAGIYIHIPFCRKACHYCNFHFSVSQNLLPQMVSAICNEAALRNSYIKEDIATIYFGGGTPSLCTMHDMQLMIDRLNGLFNISAGAEITLEANPDDINEEKLRGWKAVGINRLSIGVQSFFDEDLQWMNRAHDAMQAYKSIELAMQHNFKNVSIDLIYGTPVQTNERWQQNLERALQLNVPHLSCYALTIEPGTALQKMISLKKKQTIDAERQSTQFELLMQWAASKNYEHYEISNFAKHGFRSRHNSSYWQGKSYLGLGPSAHSFNGNSRQWNVSNNVLYIEGINKNTVPFEIETLTPTQKINEYIMTALRTKEGIELKHLKKLSGEKIVAGILKDAEKFIRRNLMKNANGLLVLTQKGKLFADGIAGDLFRV
jgi:oxygen-independent coproporphyrinogen-3 oxidase